MRDAKEVALEKWMQEVTSLLFYHPDVSLVRKEDLKAALREYIQIPSSKISSE